MFVISITLTTGSLRSQDVNVLVSSVAAATNNPVVGPGYVVRPAPHVDLNITWNSTNQIFTAGFRTAEVSTPVQYAVDSAVAYLPPLGRRERTSTGLQYDFQGPMGATYWIFPSSAPSSNNAQTLYLGLSAYGVPGTNNNTPPTFADNRIRWNVHSVENLTTPAATAFYGYSVSAGTVNMQLTLDPAYPNREMVMLANGHSHLNLLFKAAGMYRVTFRVRGTLVANGQEVSSLVPVYFGVEQWQIPAATVLYTAWRDTEFTAQQAADPLISGPEADPDGDGFTNLEEFAFGGDPLVPDAGLIAPRLEPAGDSWILTVRQRTDASGLAITPLATASLQPGLADWRAGLLTPHGQPRNVAEGIDDFDYLLNGSLTDRAFLRVRTELTSP